MKGCFRLLFTFRSCDEKWLSFAPVALLSLRAERRKIPPRQWGVYLGVLLSTQLWKCSTCRRFCACFDSDLGHHQIFKHCRALDLGVLRSVARCPASTQGAVLAEPVGRGRRDGAHANPSSNASRSDPNVFLRCAVLAMPKTAHSQ